MMHRIRLWGLLPLLLLLSGCVVPSWGGVEAVSNGSPWYFASPEEAVTEASRLLNEQNWERLAAYYDLSGNDEVRVSVEDGSFFVRPVPSGEEGAPALRRWRPFHPGSKFSHVNPTSEKNEVEVVVEYETRAGGGLKLRGYDSFRMRRNARGWQILPD